MKRLAGIVLLVLAAPSFCRAEVPERLLPADSQIYIRFDGMAEHQGDFDKTAMGKILKGDTGTLFANLSKMMRENVVPSLESTLDLEPDKLDKLKKDVAEGFKFLDGVQQHGFVLGVEAKSIVPADIQATFVFPKAGKDPKPFLALVHIATEFGKIKVKEVKIGERTVSQIAAGPVNIAWWIEGEDLAVAVGTLGPDEVLKRIAEKNLTGNALYKRVREFKEFKTIACGYADLERILKFVGALDKKAAKMIDDLGFGTLKSAVFWSGFDGPAQRSVTEIDMPGARKGVLGLLSKKTLKLGDLPPMPTDLDQFSAGHIEWTQMYDSLAKITEIILSVTSPGDVEKVAELLKNADDAVGLKIRDDLLACLDTLSVQYSAPSDGPLGSGVVGIIKVKDAKKLEKSLETVFKAIAKVTGADMDLKKRSYRGVTVREIKVRERGFVYLPTYAIHKDWLVVSTYPQPVHAFIQRTLDEVPHWKPSARVEEGLEKMPKEFTAIGVTDPTPSVHVILSFAPMVAAIAANINPELDFDMGMLPTTADVTRHLFPNVAIASQEGDKWRIESRSSVGMPSMMTSAFLGGMLFGFMSTMWYL